MAKTVLVVDDVEFVRKTITAILTDAHYQIAGEAANGEQAVKMYQELKPDIVTMDVVMPTMSGIDATRKILQIDRDAKVIIVSAMGQENLIVEAINVGARDYVLKPFTAADLIKAVKRGLMDENAGQARGAPASSERAVSKF